MQWTVSVDSQQFRMNTVFKYSILEIEMNDTTRSGSSLQPHIEHHILALREQRVMLDADLAVLYDVQTKVLVQAVKRNAEHFPADFMFRLTAEEWATLRSQTVTSNNRRGGRGSAPYAFTEQGVAMLSSVLESPRAIAVNIEIMRTFVRVRALAATHGDLANGSGMSTRKPAPLASANRFLRVAMSR